MTSVHVAGLSSAHRATALSGESLAVTLHVGSPYTHVKWPTGFGIVPITVTSHRSNRVAVSVLEPMVVGSST